MEKKAFIIRVLNPKKEGFEDSKQLTDELIKPICDSLGIVAQDASDFNKTGRISEQVLEAIIEADIVFADANSSNENVWFEIGYCHKENHEKLLYLFKEGRAVPFDLADFRGISYQDRVGYFQKLKTDISGTINNILIKSSTNKLLKSNDWKTIANKLLTNNEKDLKAITQELNRVFFNIEGAIEVRKRSIYVLSMIDQFDYLKAVPLLSDDTDDGLRVSIIESIENSTSIIPLNLWFKVLDKKQRFPILRAAARSVAIHYNKGLISLEDYKKIFLTNSEWVVRKHTAITLLDNLNKFSNSLIILKLLLSDEREEVYNRYSDWWYQIKDRDLTANEKDLCEAIISDWNNSDNADKMKIAKIISL